MVVSGVEGTPLNAWNFTRIASAGFGDPSNIVAHSMAWFRNHLYVGTSRISKQAFRDISTLRTRKAGLGPRHHDREQRAQIWRYNPELTSWDRVLESPLLPWRNGSLAPREIGYRNMVVFQSASDSGPTLYVTAISMLGPVILRSVEGVNFVPVARPQRVGTTAWSFRSLVVLNKRLYTSPAGELGSASIEYNRTSTPAIFESTDPNFDNWRQVSETGFGDPANIAVFEMAAFNDHLYAGTFNPYTGFQVWKTRPVRFPYRWKQVIRAGAFRGQTNEAVASMCVFNGGLYVGTGIQGLGYDARYNAGPGAAELIRINPDDTWDLIIGESRRTFEGTKHAVSCLGPGFGNQFSCVIWRMAEHDGWLYAGTYDWSSVLMSLGRSKAARFGRYLTFCLEKEGGFDFWRSRTGDSWELITRVGFGNANNTGLRTLLSTPEGLFVGTQALPVLQRGPTFSHDGASQFGGCEVWLGCVARNMFRRTERTPFYPR